VELLNFILNKKYQKFDELLPRNSRFSEECIQKSQKRPTLEAFLRHKPVALKILEYFMPAAVKIF
jgi:hypothetical protein